MSKAIDNEVHALKTRLRHAEKVIDHQTAELLELKTKAIEVVAELREEAKRLQWSAELPGTESATLSDAANLVAAKLGVTDPPKPPESP